MKTQTDPFTKAYIACALWSSYGDDMKPLNEHNGDISPETLAQMESDCASFKQEIIGNDFRGMEEGRAGHCFWLSRNGHGSGFFDEDTLAKEHRDSLQDHAKAYGSFDLYIGDDGLIYGS